MAKFLSHLHFSLKSVVGVLIFELFFIYGISSDSSGCTGTKITSLIKLCTYETMKFIIIACFNPLPLNAP